MYLRRRGDACKVLWMLFTKRGSQIRGVAIDSSLGRFLLRRRRTFSWSIPTRVPMLAPPCLATACSPRQSCRTVPLLLPHACQSVMSRSLPCSFLHGTFCHLRQDRVL